MDKLEKRVLKFIRDNELIFQGDNIVVGFSGGADSVALLTILFDLKALFKLKLLAVHINHGIRGREAMDDADFCRTFAEKFKVPFELIHVDTHAFMSAARMSEEEAARFLRYKALCGAGVRAFGESFKIAVAHQAGDQAETILFNLLRGSSLKGIAGMRPKRDNIIRPLLSLEKREIEKWLKDRELSFVTDSTNMENDHSRNILRNVVLPIFENEICSSSSRHITEFGLKAKEADDFIAKEAHDFLKENLCIPWLNEEGFICIKLYKEHLKEKARIFRIYVIIEALKAIEAPMKDLGERHFNDIDKLLFLGKGAHIDLKGDLSAENTYHETWIKRKGES